MDRLISMVAFVLTNKYTETGHKRYAEFISQKLELWMFVPCKLVDGVWVVFEEPKEEMEKYRMIVGEEKENILDLHSFDYDLKEYQEAKERVLFEGFEVENQSGLIHVYNKKKNIGLYFDNNFKVEQLAFGKVELTPTALKQIGL